MSGPGFHSGAVSVMFYALGLTSAVFYCFVLLSDPKISKVSVVWRHVGIRLIKWSKAKDQKSSNVFICSLNHLLFSCISYT